MTKKEWDEDLEDLLRGLMLEGYLKGKIQADNPKKYTLDTNKAKREYKIIKNHYKHQKSEMLKRLPSVIQFRNLVANFRCKKTKYFWTNDEVAIAIHKLIKDKLKEK